MRGPVQVELRVSVNENGTVSNAEYMSHGPGNYFARISHDAARSWKFRPPKKDGNPRPSVWTLRFHFQRGKTEATAVEVR
jgi:TonB family protein